MLFSPPGSLSTTSDNQETVPLSGLHRNRRLLLPKAEELYEISDKETIAYEEKLEHTEQFRFLDKAAILPEGMQPAPWKVCSVTQVEEVKILTRLMLTILGSTIIMNTCLAQLQTFSEQQGNDMYRKIGKHDFPAPSAPVIPLVFMVILIPAYEFFFVPFPRKFTGHPAGITQLQRVGVGLVLSAVSMAVAGIVEVKRRDQALKGHLISLFWLSFQYGIFGIADMFTLVELLDFFYKEAPSSMKSLSTSFTWLSLSFGYFLSTVFVNISEKCRHQKNYTKQTRMVTWAIVGLQQFEPVLLVLSHPQLSQLFTLSLLGLMESSGAKKDEEESEQNAAKRNEEESAQETDDAEAKAPSSEQSNGTK
ncbi:hypothetical protein NC652_012533 [Populus alba x Populus x berolinensis]|nr:hypothetical protein NC652_012533 [Populus alba x Populus x berolinensis]